MATPDAPSQPVCPLGVSDRTLSALRDGVMRQSEAARLAAHVEGCSACGARLSAFDDLATLLRSERSPEPDERLWRAIATAAATSPVRASLPRIWRSRFAGVGPSRPAWGTLSALAAVLLLTVGFVALLGQRLPSSLVKPPGITRTPTLTPTFTPAPTATPRPTATPDLLPASPLVWQPVDGPALGQFVESVVFANDGRSGYACTVGNDAQGGVMEIWHTFDRGAHWIPARVVPPDPSYNGCELVVDAADPSVAALAWAPRANQGDDTGLMTTVDGGVTWQAVAEQSLTQIDQLDSRGGVIYAVRETVSGGNSLEYHLWASDDRMRSWHQVDHGLPAYVQGFWLQPDGSSILLVVSRGPTVIPTRLWSSPDGGATWQQLEVPAALPDDYRPVRLANPIGYANGIVARSLQGQFHICVSNFTAQSGQSPDVTCSNDGGVTWHARALAFLDAAPGDAGSANLVGITNDGTLLAAGFGTLYRLSATANRWQSLGPLPRIGVTYHPSPDAGILWADGPAPGDTVAVPRVGFFTANYAP